MLANTWHCQSIPCESFWCTCRLAHGGFTLHFLMSNDRVGLVSSQHPAWTGHGAGAQSLLSQLTSHTLFMNLHRSGLCRETLGQTFSGIRLGNWRETQPSPTWGSAFETGTVSLHLPSKGPIIGLSPRMLHIPWAARSLRTILCNGREKERLFSPRLSHCRHGSTTKGRSQISWLDLSARLIS